MNQGTGPTLPVRNPITRPVSFHSLSEHSRNNPTYLSPHPHRRPRTPRSSPLAGPSLSSSGQPDDENKDDQACQKPKYRPNRISSTPDMAPAIQSLYDSDTASLSSPPSTASNGTIGIVVSPPSNPPTPSSSSSSEDGKGKQLNKGKEDLSEDGSRLGNIAKRLSIISTSSSLATSEIDKDVRKSTKRRSGLIPHSTSTTSLASTSSSRTARTDKSSSTAPPIPTIPRWALNAMREEAGLANRSMKYGHRRGASDDLTASPSLPPLPNQPIPRGAPLSTSGISNQPRTPSVSRDPKENWMSVTDPIPKFSRLGLRGDGVVMPVKKKESLARMKSSGSVKSTATSVRRHSGTSTRTEPGSSNPQNPAIIDASLKEDGGPRKRRSSASSSKTKIPRISVSSSVEGESMRPPLPAVPNRPGSSPASAPDSHTFASTATIPGDSTSKTVFPSIVPASDARRSSTSRRDATLAAIDEHQPPSPPSNDARATDSKSQDAQKRARRKSIKQIVMRITTAPMSAGEKLKIGSVHNGQSSPVVLLSPDTPMPLDPPPATWFGKPTNSSLPNLHSVKGGTSDSTRNQPDDNGGKRFKAIRKKWNAVLATVRR